MDQARLDQSRGDQARRVTTAISRGAPMPPPINATT